MKALVIIVFVAFLGGCFNSGNMMPARQFEGGGSVQTAVDRNREIIGHDATVVTSKVTYPDGRSRIRQEIFIDDAVVNETAGGWANRALQRPAEVDIDTSHKSSNAALGGDGGNAGANVDATAVVDKTGDWRGD